MRDASLSRAVPPTCMRILFTLTPLDCCSRVRDAIISASSLWLVSRARRPISLFSPSAAPSSHVAMSECRYARRASPKSSPHWRVGIPCAASSIQARELHGRTTVAGAGSDEDLYPTSLSFTQAAGDLRLTRGQLLDTSGMHASSGG